MRPARRRELSEWIRDYYIARFFTGLRTGEIDGLTWGYVDLANRRLRVQETIVGGETETPKTQSSYRVITLSEPVVEALQRQHRATGELGSYVFCNRLGRPLDHRNVTKRVWYPALRAAELRRRRPYQTRHTAATLWLAAGENPEWIARQLGHANTRMLFDIYSQYIPNLTRHDGSAFEQLLRANLSAMPSAVVPEDGTRRCAPLVTPSEPASASPPVPGGSDVDTAGLHDTKEESSHAA